MDGKHLHLSTSYRVDMAKYIGVDGEVKEWRGTWTAGSFENALTIARKEGRTRIVEVTHVEVWRSE